MHDLKRQLAATVDEAAPVTPAEIFRRSRRRGQRLGASVATAGALAIVLLWSTIAHDTTVDVHTTAPTSTTSPTTAPPPDTTTLVEEAPDRTSATALLDDVRVTILVEQSDDAALVLEVGAPYVPAPSDSGWEPWFQHEVVIRNVSGGPLWFERTRGSSLLGDPPTILVAAGCGYSWIMDQLVAGACRTVGYGPRLTQHGDVAMQAEWSVIRDLRGLAPGGLGSFTYEHPLRFQVPGEADHQTDTVRVHYEMTSVD